MAHGVSWDWDSCGVEGLGLGLCICVVVKRWGVASRVAVCSVSQRGGIFDNYSNIIDVDNGHRAHIGECSRACLSYCTRAYYVP